MDIDSILILVKYQNQFEGILTLVNNKKSRVISTRCFVLIHKCITEWLVMQSVISLKYCVFICSIVTLDKSRKRNVSA